ncbi:MAG: recombination regulator RecX [Clostridiales bacterium]|nr:recombination regulator RecX [Clostridiales bacterium]
MVDRTKIEYARWLALYYLSHRMLTVAMLKEKLINKGVPEAVANEALAYVAECGYLDDFDYSVRFIRDAHEIKRHGKMRIVRALREKGVDNATVEAAMNSCEINFSDNIPELIAKKAKGVDMRDYKARQKVVAFLVRRGFSYDEIKRGIEQFLEVAE